MAPKTSTRPLDMPVATWIANTHAEIAERIAVAEAKLAARSAEPKTVEPKAKAAKEPKEPKSKAAKEAKEPKEAKEAKEANAKEPKAAKEVKETKEKKAPSEWNVFCSRVRELLKSNEMSITSGISESTKFCSSLKAQKAYSEWSDEAILEARSSWVNPPSDNEASKKA